MSCFSSWESRLWSASSSPGSQFSSPVPIPGRSSISSLASCAGAIGSPATPSCWSPTSTRPSGSTDMREAAVVASNPTSSSLPQLRMKAIVCRAPGHLDVLRLEEIDRPAVPEDGLQVRVRASSINPADYFQLSRVAAIARRLNRPRQPNLQVLGIDFAGTVEAVGKNVSRFKVGDQLFGGAKGAFAEY